MGGSQSAHRARRNFSDFADVIKASIGTLRNFPRAVEFDVRCQVARKINAVTISFTVFQSKLVRSGINLMKHVDACVGGATGPATKIFWNRYPDE